MGWQKLIGFVTLKIILWYLKANHNNMCISKTVNIAVMVYIAKCMQI